MNTAADGLSVEKVHVWRGDRHVLKGVSLDAAAASVAAYLGPERHRQDHAAARRVRLAAAGAGAGVLARAVDLQRADGISGGAGLRLARTGAQGRFDGVGEPALCGRTEAPGHGRGVARQLGADRASRACADLPARVLSAGQRRRVAMARVLAMQASLWLLDEPFTNLDAAGTELMAELLQSHVRAGRSGAGGRAPRPRGRRGSAPPGARTHERRRCWRPLR